MVRRFNFSRAVLVAGVSLTACGASTKMSGSAEGNSDGLDTATGGVDGEDPGERCPVTDPSSWTVDPAELPPGFRGQYLPIPEGLGLRVGFGPIGSSTRWSAIVAGGNWLLVNFGLLDTLDFNLHSRAADDGFQEVPAADFSWSANYGALHDVDLGPEGTREWLRLPTRYGRYLGSDAIWLEPRELQVVRPSKRGDVEQLAVLRSPNELQQTGQSVLEWAGNARLASGERILVAVWGEDWRYAADPRAFVTTARWLPEQARFDVLSESEWTSWAGTGRPAGAFRWNAADTSLYFSAFKGSERHIARIRVAGDETTFKFSASPLSELAPGEFLSETMVGGRYQAVFATDDDFSLWELDPWEDHARRRHRWTHSRYRPFAVGAVDGDNRPDVAYINEDEELRLYLSERDDTLTLFRGDVGETLLLKDADGDGRDEILVGLVGAAPGLVLLQLSECADELTSG